jgi:hypothetical protein
MGTRGKRRTGREENRVRNTREREIREMKPQNGQVCH